MRHLSNILLAAVIAGLGFVGSAQAHSVDWQGAWHDSHSHRALSHGDARFLRHVDRRQARQRHRIHEGWKSGELTRKEIKRLRKGQRRIARLKREFRSDGFLSPRERRVVRNALDNASDRIYRKKHNDRYRFVGHHGRHPAAHGDGLVLWDDGAHVGGNDGEASRGSRPSRRRGHRD